MSNLPKDRYKMEHELPDEILQYIYEMNKINNYVIIKPNNIEEIEKVLMNIKIICHHQPLNKIDKFDKMRLIQNLYTSYFNTEMLQYPDKYTTLKGAFDFDNGSNLFYSLYSILNKTQKKKLIDGYLKQKKINIKFIDNTDDMVYILTKQKRIFTLSDYKAMLIYVLYNYPNLICNKLYNYYLEKLKRYKRFSL